MHTASLEIAKSFMETVMTDTDYENNNNNNNNTNNNSDNNNNNSDTMDVSLNKGSVATVTTSVNVVRV